MFTCFYSSSSLPFNELIKRASQTKQSEFFIDENEKYYLRSLGDDERKDVADIKYFNFVPFSLKLCNEFKSKRKQFPDLSNDFNIPPLFETSKFFSSVFRISSANLRLWTHYDVRKDTF